MEKQYFVHEKSDVQTPHIGEGSRIWQYCVILKNAVIGKNCNINSHCFVENDVVVGDNVTVKSGVQLWDGITVENDVFIGPNVAFTNDMYPRSKVYPDEFKKTLVKQGASIGANATIICGVVLGERCLIGAGSVVTKDVPAGELWFGNPASCRGKAPT